MHRFRGTDIWLGILAVVVNVGLVVGVVLLTTGRPTVDDPTPAKTTPTTTSTTATASTTTTATPAAPRSPEELLASGAKMTIAVLGDQTSDGESEWVTAFSQLLAQDRRVTLNRLNPADPTQYTIKASFGSSGPATEVYNGSRADAPADYAAMRVPFLVPVKPDVVILNYGRNDSASNVKKHLEGAATAVKASYPLATVLVTLQPPTLDDQGKKVRAAAAAWARSKKLRTLDIAAAFAATGAPNSFVSAADPDVLNMRGDALWGQTVFTLLGGKVRAPVPAPTQTVPAPVTTTGSTSFPAPSSSSSAALPPPSSLSSSSLSSSSSPSSSSPSSSSPVSTPSTSSSSSPTPDPSTTSTSPEAASTDSPAPRSTLPLPAGRTPRR